MYYIIYGLLYVLSLLPFPVIYGISDFASFVLGRIVRYRRDIVLGNLAIAFPEKAKEEHIKIMRQFYRNFTDNFLETLKILSMSGATLDRRVTIDMRACNQLASDGRNIQFNSGHQMNWEYASLSISKHLKLPWLAVYKKIGSRPIERLFLKIRSRWGAVMVALEDYAFRMPTLMKQQYALGLIADQNPAFPNKSYWLNFFNRPAPFLTGTDKGARRAKTAVVFVNISRIKRGYFNIDLKIVTEDASQLQDGDLTRSYRDYLEKNIRLQPANYLWSHRRWKHEYKEEYAKRWIEDGSKG